MEETISTTSEVTTEQTTPDVVEETTQPAETEQTTEETTTQEPETVATTETETEQPTKNWEQIAKDNQASFTRVSQELGDSISWVWYTVTIYLLALRHESNSV